MWRTFKLKGPSEEGLKFYPSIVWQDMENNVVGHADVRFPASEAKVLKRVPLDVDKRIVHPPRTVEALKRSFRAHSRRRIKGKVPSQREQEYLLSLSYQKYPRFKEPAHGMDDETLKESVILEWIDYAIANVKRSASPGFPYAAYEGGKDNGTFIDTYRDELRMMVLQRLVKLAAYDVENLSSSECVEEGLVDPVRMFIKNEGHPLRKQKSETWRLISSVSIVDSLVESVLSRFLNKKEIQNWPNIPSKPGMGDTDFDREILLRTLSQVPERGWAAADVTGFDWSIQPWEIELDAERRRRMMKLQPNSWAARALKTRAKLFSRMVFCMSDGTLMEPDIPGIQLSGSQNTSSLNSTVRFWIASLVGARVAVANGDDCLEEYVEGAVEKYRTLGHPLKFYGIQKDQLEFCSLQFNLSEQTVRAVNMDKSLFNLVDKEELIQERALQFKERFRGCDLGPADVAVKKVFGRNLNELVKLL